MDVFQNINGKINEEVVISFIANRLNLKVVTLSILHEGEKG
jgi:hypothetical protein